MYIGVETSFIDHQSANMICNSVPLYIRTSAAIKSNVYYLSKSGLYYAKKKIPNGVHKCVPKRYNFLGGTKGLNGGTVPPNEAQMATLVHHQKNQLFLLFLYLRVNICNWT